MTKVALVTNFPDGCTQARPLEEYGLFLFQAMTETADGGSVRVISSSPGGSSHPSDCRVWDYGGLTIPFQILRALKPRETVLFSVHFTSWGGLVSNMLGLITPMLTKLAGHRTVVLLHHLPQTMDAKKAGYNLTPVHWQAIDIACRALAMADVVCFTMKRDVDYFRAHYKRQNVKLIPLGLQGKPCWEPICPHSEPTLLFLGNMGRSKNPEPVIQAFLDSNIQGRFLIAGQSSHTNPGFAEGLATKYVSDRVEFLGYVPEPEIQGLFHRAHMVVLPYNENPGTSAVMMQAAQFGRPAIATTVFREMAESLGVRMFYYSSQQELQTMLRSLLSQHQVLNEAGLVNYEAVTPLNLEYIARQYWQLLRGKVENGQETTAGGAYSAVGQRAAAGDQIHTLEL